ncbi:hypothetical protein PMIN06_009653 [Paraphaeosphaeria minitans]
MILVEQSLCAAAAFAPVWNINKFHTSFIIMEQAQKKNIESPALLVLPNEIFLDIVHLLCTSDLRSLGRVNCRLRGFVIDYLYRYRYNVGIHALPNELTLEIAQHLGHQKDRSRLARASQRFYPLIMRYIIRHNVVNGGSSLMNYAAKRNLVGMARKMICLGGDVNTQHGFSTKVMGKTLTPLATAACYGHQRMVRMLLKFGASHFIDGVRLPLALAILKRCENVALILSQELDSSDTSFTSSTRQTLLQMACAAQLVILARYYLENIPYNSHDCDIALFRIIQKDASKTEFIQRQLHEEVFQIVLMLVRHGASPDVCVRTGGSVVTTRGIASRHPDPRIRNIFLKLTNFEKPKASASHIGRPWMSSENKVFELQKSAAEVYALQESRYATLWDFVEASTEDAATDMEEQGMFLSSDAKVAYLMESGLQRARRRSERATPPPSSSYPGLGVVQGSAQHTLETFWANFPPRNLSESPPPKRNVESLGSRSANHTEKPAEEEDFPALAYPRSRQDDYKKNVWADFRSKGDSPSLSNDERTSHDDGGVTLSVRKKSKKKWVPLSL